MSSYVAVMSQSRIWAAYFREMRYEFLKSLRTPAFSIPTLFFPVMFYVLFGVLLGSMRGSMATAQITFANFGVFGAMGPGLFGFGVALAIEREQGLLTLKQALPQPPGAYLLARAVMAMLFAAAISFLLTIMALTLGKVPLTVGQIAGLFVINSLGALPFCAIGLFMGALVSGQASPAIINFIFLPMAFLSGLFIPLQVMPGILQDLAVIWPAYHLSQMALSIVGSPSHGSFASHVAVLAGTTIFFFLLAVKRLHGSGFRLLGPNPKRALISAALVGAAVVGLSLAGVFGGGQTKSEDATAATDAPSAADSTPAPSEPLLADFDQGSERTAFGNGMNAGGDQSQGGNSTATQKLVDGGAGGSKAALLVSGEVRPGAPYPSAGTFFFPEGEIMRALLDLSGKKTLRFQARGDGKQYTLIMLIAGQYIPQMRPFTAGPEWQDVSMDLTTMQSADLRRVQGFGMISMAPGPFEFQIDDLRLE